MDESFFCNAAAFPNQKVPMASHCGMHVPQPNGASGVKSIISHILAHGAKSSAGRRGESERDSKGARHQAARAGRLSKEAQGSKAAAEGKRREPPPAGGGGEWTRASQGLATATNIAGRGSW